MVTVKTAWCAAHHHKTRPSGTKRKGSRFAPLESRTDGLSQKSSEPTRIDDLTVRAGGQGLEGREGDAVANRANRTVGHGHVESADVGRTPVIVVAAAVGGRTKSPRAAPPVDARRVVIRHRGFLSRGGTDLVLARLVNGDARRNPGVTGTNRGRVVAPLRAHRVLVDGHELLTKE